MFREAEPSPPTFVGGGPWFSLCAGVPSDWLSFTWLFDPGCFSIELRTARLLLHPERFREASYNGPHDKPGYLAQRRSWRQSFLLRPSSRPISTRVAFLVVSWRHTRDLRHTLQTLHEGERAGSE